MNDNFGLGAFGLDMIEYPDPKKSQPIFAKEDFQTKEKRRIERQRLECVKRYYEEHPDSILPSGEFGSRSHRDENGSIVMERTVRIIK